LAVVDLARTAAAILAVGVDQVPNLIDAIDVLHAFRAVPASRIFPNQHFGGSHAYVRPGFEGPLQIGEKIGLSFRIIV
jgi:hypothetical protein